MDGPEIIDIDEEEKPNFEEKKKVFVFGPQATASPVQHVPLQTHIPVQPHVSQPVQSVHAQPAQSAPPSTSKSYVPVAVSLAEVKVDDVQFLNLEIQKPILIVEEHDFNVHKTPIGDVKVCKVTTGGAKNQPPVRFCFNAIVKNEEKCILRRLNNIKHLIDEICITDTGSTDKTMDLIHSFGLENNIPTKIYNYPFTNFEDARTTAIKNAKEHLISKYKSVDDWYLMFGDADDLNFGGEFMKVQRLPEKDRPLCPKFDKTTFDADVYQIDMVSGITLYPYVWMVRLGARREFDWKTPIHEFVRIREWKEKRNPLYRKIFGSYVESRREGFRSLDTEKYLRDALTFEKALKIPDKHYENKDEKDKPDRPRITFYLAQSYRDSNFHKQSFENYERRYNMGGFHGELYCSLMNMMTIGMERLNKKKEELYDIAFKAMNIDPNRLEVPYYLIKILSQTPMFDFSDELKINSLKADKSRLIENINILKKDPKQKVKVVNTVENWESCRKLNGAAWTIIKAFKDVVPDPNALFLNILIHDHQFYFDAGNIAINLGHMAEAKDLFRKCLSANYLDEKVKSNIREFWKKRNVDLEAGM